jgi:hypothetical protein
MACFFQVYRREELAVRIRWACVGCIAGSIALPLMAHGDEALSLEVRPTFCLDPCAIRLTVEVNPDESNRELLLEADSPGFYRSSVVQLDGEAEPSVHTLTWKALPAGRYAMRATLRRASGDLSHTGTIVRVIGHRGAGE